VETKIVQFIPTVEVQYYALSTGEIELLEAPPKELEAVAEADPNIEIHNWISDYIMYLTMNQRRYPNNVTEFRQAVLYALNRTEIIDTVGYGRGLVAPASMSLPYGPYYNPDIEQYLFNLDYANDLLDDLGWLDTDEDDIREDGLGDPLEFNLMVSAEYQESVDAARMIQDYMLDIGVSITLQPVIFDVLWSAVGGPGGTYVGKYDYDWAYLGWVGFWSDRHPNWASWMFNENGWWGSDDVNIPGWSGPARTNVTDLCELILYETNETKVLEYLNEIQVIVADSTLCTYQSFGWCHFI
jgi:peptide/nickel transport system substrate-binding protein